MAPKVLLIDDDTMFAKRLLKEGRRRGADIEWYSSFAELGRIGSLGNYDCVIAGLSSDPVTGIEIAQYATAFFSDLPVVLVSEDDGLTNVTSIDRLPPAVQARVPKAVGAEVLLGTALRMLRKSGKKKAFPIPRARATRCEMTA